MATAPLAMDGSPCAYDDGSMILFGCMSPEELSLVADACVGLAGTRAGGVPPCLPLRGCVAV